MNSSLVRRRAKLFLSIFAISGIIVLLEFVRTPSEMANQIFLGLSFRRLAVGAIFAFILLLNIGSVLWMSSKQGAWKIRLEPRFLTWVARHITWITMGVYILSLAGSISLLVVLHPFESIFFPEAFRVLLIGPILWFFLLNLFLFISFRISYGDQIKVNKFIVTMEGYFLIGAVFLVTYLVYQHILILAASPEQQTYSYWNLLADEFLKGRIYLSNPPYTVDLTFHQGKWYVPMPPLPAILMMLPASFIGGKNIDARYFSIFFSSINTVTTFLILKQFSRRQWVKLSLSGILLLVVLFAFGTPHLWVGINGRVWFVSQIVTVTFIGLAVYAVFWKRSPWIVGAFLGLAILSRPNAIMTWLFAFAIAMQIMKEEQGSVSVRCLVSWSMRSLIPVLIAVGCLLIYNDMRFGNFLDFGYVTINGNPIIVENAQRYGIFSMHFVLINLKVMFLNLPSLDLGSRWPIIPSSAGMNVFLTTPVLLYLFHRYEYKWWILGAWLSVLLNFTLLILYHNTGANQFGYRYILDAIIPILALLTLRLERRVPWHFLLLLILSIGINIYGTFWFMNR